ncbi:hypothetical protein XENTR_v10014046 [Xenopus tropicalis]|nr:hypothetical protein XENTR_v10014046 [Xenopus tropicalis]
MENICKLNLHSNNPRKYLYTVPSGAEQHVLHQPNTHSTHPANHYLKEVPVFLSHICYTTITDHVLGKSMYASLSKKLKYSVPHHTEAETKHFFPQKCCSY